jgi:nucleoside-diphosphate-sugar epimerase
MIPRPISPYAVTKLAGEYYCKVFYDLFALETVSLRYFNVYGENQNPFSQYSAVIPKFISKLLSGERPVIDGDGCQTRDFTYVKDVVDANIKSIRKGITGVFNIAGGKNISINELFKKVRKITKVNIEPIYGSPRLGDVRDSLADISKARIKLGFVPSYSLEDGLRETVDWYRKSLRK